MIEAGGAKTAFPNLAADVSWGLEKIPKFRRAIDTASKVASTANYSYGFLLTFVETEYHFAVITRG